MIAFVASNPWRVPQWRWMRAVNILEGGPETTARRDTPEGCKWIRRAKHFKTALDEARHEQQQLSLALEQPDLFWAYYAFSNPMLPARWAIEAHLLARETNREIAFRNGCDELVVEAYEALFFNVREKINHREYVVTSVFGDAVQRGLNERQYDLLWKLFGYAGGPHVLDSLISKLPTGLWASRPDNVASFFQDVAIDMMKKKAAVAALTVPVNSSTHLHLIEAFVKYVEVERTTDSMGKAQDQILANISALLSGMPFKMGNHVGAHDDNPIAEYDRTSVELRNDELVVVAAGHSLPGQAMLQDLTFPEITHEQAGS